MVSNYIGDLMEDSYVRMEYIFEDYKNTKSIKDRLKKLDGVITGQVSYSGLTGIDFASGSQVKINGKLQPVGDDITTGMCFFWTLSFSGNLGEEFILFRRGKLGAPNSMKLSLVKSDKNSRVPVLDIVFQNA